MNLLLIDHEDSFTYNLAHLLSSFGNLEVTNFYDVKENSVKKSDVIIFSPGPGKPLDYPISLDIYNNYKSKKKIIGICLGFQLIANGEGGIISKQEFDNVQLRYNQSSHKYDICGLQFHPDSFLTPNGKQFIRKIIQFKK